MVGSFKSADINLSQINQWIFFHEIDRHIFWLTHMPSVYVLVCVCYSVWIWVNVRQHASVHKLKHWTIYMQNIQHIRLGLDFLTLCICFFLKYLIFWTERHSRGYWKVLFILVVNRDYDLSTNQPPAQIISFMHRSIQSPNY